MPVAYHEPSTPTPPSSSSSSEWGPYSDSKDFTSNMVIILIILFCFLVLLFALNALIRYLLFPLHRHHRGSHHPFSIDDPEKNPCPKPAASAAEVGPTLVFSASGREKIAGTGAECSICLAEFADGDRVLVLQACSHGFHVSCIERWLVTKESCPTCRASCHVAPV